MLDTVAGRVPPSQKCPPLRTTVQRIPRTDSESREIRKKRLACKTLVLMFVLELCSVAALFRSAQAETVAVRQIEGTSHGFLVLRTLQGQILASGDMIQTVKGEQVTSETVLHFKDGSLHQETTVFSQNHVFHLISDHVVQSGPAFRHPIDIFIDAERKEAKIISDKKTSVQSIRLPEDAANGLVPTLVRNIPPSPSETKVSMLTSSAKPRLIQLSISSQSKRTFSVGTLQREAADYRVKVELGGVAGVVAPIVGKQPPDIHILVSQGAARTFVRFEGPLCGECPVWRIELADIKVSNSNQNSSPVRAEHPKSR